MEKEIENELWKSYFATKATATREKLIAIFMPYAKNIAGSIYNHIPDSVCVQDEDLIGWAYIALIDAIDNCTEELYTTFRTYMYTRVKGYILNELEALNDMTAYARKRITTVHNERDTFYKKYGRVPTESELAEALNTTAKDISKLLQMDSGYKESNYIEDITPDASLMAVDNDMEFEEELNKLLNGLTEKEKAIFIGIHIENKTQKELSKEINMSEARITQVNKHVLQVLKGKVNARS